MPATPTPADVLDRILNQWWLGYIFWGAGQAAILFLRPRDARWRAFIAFNFLTAIWLSASSLSQTHFGESAIVLHMTIWLCVPVYWHLHWLLPQPLGRVPVWALFGFYGAATLLAALEWFQVLPPTTYVFAFLLAFGGSVLLLFAHMIFRPAERRGILLLFAGVILAVGLPIIPGLFAVTGGVPSQPLATLLALPLLPAAYLYAAFRRQTIDLEIRTNRIITVYLFAVLLGMTVIVFSLAADAALTLSGESLLIAVATATLSSLAVAFGFRPFQRFVESSLLRMPLPQAHLLETYAARITVSLSLETLVKLIREEIMPSLLIRESALLRFEEGIPHLAYAQGLSDTALPTPAELAHLLTDTGHFREAPQAVPWVRLALVLTIDNSVRGLWLLGRRDPDDAYGAEDIRLLKSLANQTAIALTNIAQAESLRALYQRDIEQNETERYHVARELHDHLLNEIARLEISVDDAIATPEFIATCESLIKSIRQTIRDLRPDALNYGLYHALLALPDDLTERWADQQIINFKVLSSPARYAPLVELYVYRIVQQACDNALKHATPQQLTVQGSLTDGHIELCIEDDGSGFVFSGEADIARLAAQKHYGLAGMFERASITGALLKIHSTPGNGSRIEILWPSGNLVA